jgi:transposase
LEDLPDRQAAEMVVMRMDWKYALRQELGWTGFHYSSLCNFRKRLYEHGQTYAVFEQLVAYLQAAGYLKAQRQRTDATHILGAVERLSRLELVWETLRLTVGALISTDAPWVLTHVPASFVEFHTRRRSDYRLSEQETQQAMQAAGQDGWWLLDHLARQGTPQLLALSEVTRLRRVLSEQFEPPDDDGPPTVVRANTTACGDVISTPHDPDVRFARKGQDTTWRGYKVQLTETIQTPPFITDITVRSSLEHDSQALPIIQQHLHQRSVTPAVQVVDRAYVNGSTLQASADQHIDLRGFAPDDTRKPPGFRLQDFQVDLTTRTATCPQGHASTVFSPSQQADVAFHVRFGKVCFTGPVHSICTTEARGRSLQISPHHDRLMARRREQQTATFHHEMHQRSRIESCISEVVRAHGLRRARYRGAHKVALQAAFTATAVNLKRLVRSLTVAGALIDLTLTLLRGHLTDFSKCFTFSVLSFSTKSHRCAPTDGQRGLSR